MIFPEGMIYACGVWRNGYYIILRKRYIIDFEWFWLIIFSFDFKGGRFGKFSVPRFDF